MIANLQMNIRVRLPINLLNSVIFIFLSVYISDYYDEDNTVSDNLQMIFADPFVSILCLIIIFLMFEAYNYHLSVLIKDRLIDVLKIKEL
jgi:ABC-type multidrug transport system permease subunit